MAVGRSSSCDLSLSLASVSYHHALIRWDGEKWLVRDFGSSNGTYLNGRRIAASNAEGHPLRRDDELVFADPSEVWIVVDDSAPEPSLLPADGSAPIRLREECLTALPDEAHPSGIVYQECGRWRFESAQGGLMDLSDGQTITLGDKRFRVRIPDRAPETQRSRRPVLDRLVHRIALKILVAEDEETASVSAVMDGTEVTFGPKVHLYLLAYLARLRLSPRGRHAAEEGGWVSVEQACRDLRVDAEALALLVFRCRKDFERVGFQGASSLIDRLKRGFLRLGVPADQVAVQYRSQSAGCET
ncbi:MAG: FHA domain-containing protein [Polyangiaceae bacterium]